MKATLKGKITSMTPHTMSSRNDALVRLGEKA